MTLRNSLLYVNGEWIAAENGATLDVVNPATGKIFGRVARAGAFEVSKAVAAAKAAFPSWSKLDAAERARYLASIADELEARRADLIDLQSLNSGKPLFEAEIDLNDAVATYRYYAGHALTLGARQGESVDLGDGFVGRTRFEPLGVAALIVPWNFPLVTSGWKSAAALAAGCTVVLKASEFTPFAELILGEIADKIGLPKGVLNILVGEADCGQALVENPHVRKVSFTGSNAVGEDVMRRAALRAVPVTLELGGKSPILVFADADPADAARWVLEGIFYNCGQVCSATSRLLVEADFADTLRRHLQEAVSAISIGSPLDPQTTMGPLTTARQFEKVKAFLAIARDEGLKAIAGGKQLEGTDGYFIEPTIYWDVPSESRLWREEVFGPILCVQTFRAEDEAIAKANDTPYGLAATIVSKDPERVRRVSEQLQAGHIWINSSPIVFPQSAWGGFKQSGIGRELGPWGLFSYLGVKHMTEML
ncbi:betaine-aldehyde dehydrogenase [Rhizobium sp. BK313]|jgi:betaine-aldehyde dehydrogenase|uniref:aldehyde dehydrogenase family protein n=1 Tax=Rhizobium sp. BK313 TaxID=2587081 RepID=UPI00105CA02B|nr:aldehyde dehydrogenase family protein [Rhizobium sp. BK313]MBB3458025.1 betaine-aldehyde dehydrogenase [Rhizobium sp. BK313]